MLRQLCTKLSSGGESPKQYGRNQGTAKSCKQIGEIRKFEILYRKTSLRKSGGYVKRKILLQQLATDENDADS